MDISDGEANAYNEFLEIFKVQFVASSKTAVSDNLMVAFYLEEHSRFTSLCAEWIAENYVQEGDSFLLIDYKAYAEICELTGETGLSPTEDIQEIETGRLGVNTLLSNEDHLLNYDQQKDFWKKQAEAK